MGSLTRCLRDAGALLSDADKAAVLARAQDYRAAGDDAATAARKAIDDHLAALADEMRAGPQPPAPPKPKKPSADPVQRALDENPAMQLVDELTGERIDAAEYLRAAKEVAQQDKADAPLYEVAAQCAITNGL